MLIPSLSLRTWAMIGTGAIIALLVIALLMTRATLSETKREREAAEMKLSVSNASIGTMKGEIARMVAEQKSLAASDANRITASRQKLQIIKAVENVRQAAIDKLNASAEMIRPDVPAGHCNVSATFMENWQ